jgi:hypothetical protein
MSGCCIGETVAGGVEQEHAGFSGLIYEKEAIIGAVSSFELHHYSSRRATFIIGWCYYNLTKTHNKYYYL